MTNLFFEGQLVVSLNQLSQIPLPLAKYLLEQWILYIQGQPNLYKHQSIAKYFASEGVDIDYRDVIGSVQYLFKSSKKIGLARKQLSVLINQNTMLSSEHSNTLLEIYESFLSKDGSGAIMSNSFKDMKWSAVSLRQTQDKQMPNKIYMKVEFNCNNQYGEMNRTVDMTLLQFKLLLQEANKVQSLINV